MMKTIAKFSWVFYILLIIPIIMSCKKDEAEPAVIASFTYSVDPLDFKKITFTSQSQNYASLLWNFGDNGTSTSANPVHTYAATGQYTVKLTATSPDGVQDAYSQTITIADPNEMLTMLVGESSKVWKLLRVTSSGRYPCEVGPADYSSIWWAMGLGNDELANRPCMLNDEWKFSRDGLKMDFDAKGDYWAEGGVFDPANICASTDNMVGPNGEDLSAWGSGSHTFVLTPGSPSTLKVVGLGAYLGLCKAATGAEVKVPQESVTYEIIKLTDGPVDTLIVQTAYMTGGGSPQPAYWRFVLMHYDNPDDEPPIPGNKPNVSFSTSITGNVVTFTNNTVGGDTYLWDFGDGTTSTDMNPPAHTYAGGPFVVKLTATNAFGTSESSSLIFVSTAELTDALLQGAAWRVQVSDKSVFVGPGLGSAAWWSVPKNFLETGTGGDDWTCMPNDEFTFSAGGVFTYNTMGTARNDGYFGTPNGCWDDAQIAGSPGAPFGNSTNTYLLTPASGTSRAILEVTNGTTTPGGVTSAAFIGFYKGYYGGENGSSANPPNGGLSTNRYEVMGYANTGTKEYLFVSVDISADHSGGAAWSAILER